MNQGVSDLCTTWLVTYYIWLVANSPLVGKHKEGWSSVHGGCESWSISKFNYSGTSINSHLVKAVTYRITASIAGPKRPPNVHNVLLYS